MFSSPLARILPIFAISVGATALTFGALIAPQTVDARTNAAYYTAELAEPAKAEQMIVGGSLWQCAGTTCVAAKARSRPAIVCGKLRREAGVLAAFTAKGKALDTKQLARCNAD